VFDRDPRFNRWLAELEARHFADLTFPEVARALRALSSAYVERRRKLAEGAAFSGAGKRAAFALFYAPLHFFFFFHIVRRVPRPPHRVATIVDLGCGTGAASAAWAACEAEAAGEGPRILGVDRNAWALGEATATYRSFGIEARVRRGDLTSMFSPPPRGRSIAWLAAFTVNELSGDARDALLPRLLDRVERGDRVLVVEPIGRVVGEWWTSWRDAFEAAGGRADEWRFRLERPPIVARLDHAAGLNHREITGRSLSLG